jgi:hypothetical protein
MDRLQNLHWKDVALGAILIIQALIGYTWLDMATAVKANSNDIHALQLFEVETRANRYTASDAKDDQRVWLEQLEGIRTDMRNETRAIRNCINVNIVEGRRMACE